MAKIICFCNQKGGVGKTTAAVNIAASLAAAEKKVLLVDFDPQGNATSGLGIEKNPIHSNSYDLISGDDHLVLAPFDTLINYLHMVPSTRDLVGAEVELVSLDRREYRLKDALSALSERYDYVFIDSPPSLGLLTINALAASNEVIIPVQCEYYALEGISELMRTIDRVKTTVNQLLRIRGVLLMMFDPRNRLSHQVADEVRGFFKEKVYETVIPRSVRLAEAPSYGKPILLYDARSRGTRSFLDLAREFLEQEGIYNLNEIKEVRDDGASESAGEGVGVAAAGDAEVASTATNGGGECVDRG